MSGFCPFQTHMIVKPWDLLTMINKWALGTVSASPFLAVPSPCSVPKAVAYRMGTWGSPTSFSSLSWLLVHLHLFRADPGMQVPETEFYQTFPGLALRDMGPMLSPQITPC